MSKAYLIHKNEVIAIVDTNLKNGAEVEFSSVKVEEHINANREYNLVSAQTAKISRAKKWEAKSQYVGYATEINPAEFLL